MSPASKPHDVRATSQSRFGRIIELTVREMEGETGFAAAESEYGPEEGATQGSSGLKLVISHAPSPGPDEDQGTVQLSDAHATLHGVGPEGSQASSEKFARGRSDEKLARASNAGASSLENSPVLQAAP